MMTLTKFQGFIVFSIIIVFLFGIYVLVSEKFKLTAELNDFCKEAEGNKSYLTDYYVNTFYLGEGDISIECKSGRIYHDLSRGCIKYIEDKWGNRLSCEKYKMMKKYS